VRYHLVTVTEIRSSPETTLTDKLTLSAAAFLRESSANSDYTVVLRNLGKDKKEK
jgi:hypothetical protein